MITTRLVPIVGLLCALTAPANAEALKTLPPGPRPIPVTIGTYLIDVQKIDESTLTYVLVAYLHMEWRDARLRMKAAPSIDRTMVTIDQVWSPNIEFANQHTPRQVANSQLTIDDEGLVKYDERFSIELSTEFNLRHFPFDRQTLPMSIESFRYDESDVQLVAQHAKHLKSAGAFLPDWFITDVIERIHLDTANPEERTYSLYTLDIHVLRKQGYYYWNVFLPLTFITLLAWAVFFVSPDDLQTRTGVSITALLTAIAFSLVISGTRPRVSYLTFMDAAFLSSYFLIFVAIVFVIAAHFMIRQTGRSAGAERLAHIGRYAFPALMLVTYALVAFDLLH